MSDKHKTLDECKDQICIEKGYTMFTKPDWARLTYSDLDEAAELYAGQTKQSEKTHGDENPVEFMRGKINEYFHDWRKSETDSPIIEIDGNTLSEITFKAELETKKKFPWIRYKQSEPVSLEVEQAFQKFNESFDYDKCLTKTGIDSSVAAKAGFIAGWQSQQPASIQWLSDEEIKEIFPISGEKQDSFWQTSRREGARHLQSELRKRVIDPYEFAKESFYEFLEWHKQKGFISIKPGDFEEYLTHKTKDNE